MGRQGRRASRAGLARPAIFGSFDGTASLLGVVIYLAMSHPSLIFPAAVSGAVSSAVSMGGGEWLSDSDQGFAASLVMAGATFTGALLPAVPFAFTNGALAIAESAVVCAGIAFAVAVMRPGRSVPMALTETFGILAVVAVVVIVCGLMLPGGAP